MISKEKQELLLTAMLSGQRVSVAGESAGVNTLTSVRYYNKWKESGKIPPNHECYCGRQYAHIGACQGTRYRPQPTPLPVSTPILIRTAHSEGEWGQMLVDVRHELFSWAVRNLRNTAQAEDAVQQTIVQALRARTQYQKGTNFKSWIYRVLRNNLASSFRRKPTSNIDLVPEALTSIPEGTTDLVLANEIIVQIARLAPDQRDVCFCIWVDGMEYGETAKRYGVSVGTVKSRLWRARCRLRGVLVGGGSLEEEAGNGVD